MKNGKVEKKLSMFRGSRSDTTRQAGITRPTPSQDGFGIRRNFESKMAAQADKIDFYKTAYIFADPTHFFNRQTLKCCPFSPYIPSVFVCGVSEEIYKI
jgi:hypothetical protein